MQHFHVCVWLDHREARIVGVGINRADQINVSSEKASHKIHRKADYVGLETEPLDTAFMQAIAEMLSGAGAILLCGPGRAKVELASYLHRRHPALSRKVWTVEPMEDISDGQLAAAANKYFRNASRVHS
jgi:stalled ribosome rescue protein Dom34